MSPVPGRPIPFKLLDADKKVSLTDDFSNLAEILRYRATMSSAQFREAFILVDEKGKESMNVNWEKINAKAEKIARTIKQRGVKCGERVALIYRKSDILEFIPALFGCFFAGVTAVPVNTTDDLSELTFILNLTSIYLILTTEYNHKAFIKEMQAKSTELPPNITWVTTNNLGLWYPSKKEKRYPPVPKLPETAYIEFVKSSCGELKGVTVTHKSLMEQCAAFHASTMEAEVTVKDEENIEVNPKRSAKGPETVVTYFEPRQQVGLILSVLYAVYAANITIFAGGFIIDTPAVWIYVLSKYKATMALADYTSLINITKYFTHHTKEVKSFSKKVTPDLSSLRHLITDTHTIHCETNQYIADKLLRPLGNSVYPINVVHPILSLPEYGGKIISMRDHLGPAFTEEHILTEETMILEDGQQVTRPVMKTKKVLSSSQSGEIFSCVLDAQALKQDKITVLAAGPNIKVSEHATDAGTVCKGSFGFCMPNSTVAIVDPETTTLCPPNKVGEVWVDSSSIGGGFWGLSMHTEAIFHAKPIVVSPDTMQPELCEGSYLRTGLNGAIISGRLFILGPYEERIRQQRLGAEFGVEDVFYVSDLVKTITNRTHIEHCTVFDILLKEQHLPVIVCEAEVKSRSELASIATQIDEALIEIHGLRPYIISFVKPNGLARHLIHGRRFIHPIMTKSYFLRGYLTMTHVKMDVDRTIFNLAENLDTSGKNFWTLTQAYETAIRTGIILPYPQQQHTSMEKVSIVKDERSGFELSAFTNIIDILNHRATMFPDNTAFTVATQSGTNTTNTKPYSWKKLSYKSANVATLLAKKGLKAGIKVLVMVPFSIDYVFSVYACLAMGIVPVPLEPIDIEVQKQHPHRIKEFAEAFVEITKDLGITTILVNSNSDNVLKNNIVKSVIREASIKNHYHMPESVNVSKAPKHHKMLGKESGFIIRPEWVRRDRKSPTLILVQNTSDGRRYYSMLGHETILHQCRTQIKTCQMRYQRSIVVTGLGTYEGLGFLHALFCGVYVGCNTTLIPSADFYINPAFFFETLQRFKAKDVFVTNALVQFAMNRMKNYAEYKHLNLKGVQNIMLASDDRSHPHMYQYMANFFYKHKAEKGTFSSIYSHAANPMITTRSYMVMEPITIAVDTYWLRQGVIHANLNPIDSRDSSRVIVLNDSGIVPSNTMVAIVNPVTLTLCPNNVIGEIWVSSDSNAKSFYTYSSGDTEHAQVFEATIAGSDPNIKYLRTGDVGFLWNMRRRIESRNTMQHSMFEDGQCLYVLGSMKDIITRNGLIFFPMDVEHCIERCESTIAGSIIIQNDNEIVVIASVKLPENGRETINEHARAVVSLIVNAVLDNHSFLIDTVVIVHPSNFPRSKFGEKLRGKARLSYSRKKL
ncbi:hypothetical protein BDF20DRAFT_820289 [Mycotypha africana]|uniref:uncharacterized protein n=1 Tax=Mycotypha africana TaxID=64632 RepID=UPI00230040BB|nr:uncharacterized protein BDF20DRAFT_820289 [Mycotypha africana]KAI8979625.1 hypothetical protein BDF20DRAFT_820289 [Mycotypha africana]